MTSTTRWLLPILLWTFWGVPASAQNPVETHLLVDLVGRNTGEKDYVNTTMFGNSNFHSLRVRFFWEKKVSDNFEIFTQMLSDNARSPRISGT